MEEYDENDRMPSASHSFFISLSYLAFMFIALVLSSVGFEGSLISLMIIVILISRNMKSRK
jgi:glucan phosphoethanolaminetransferase (alkaline phosphatase superfamily)